MGLEFGLARASRLTVLLLNGSTGATVVIYGRQTPFFFRSIVAGFSFVERSRWRRRAMSHRPIQIGISQALSRPDRENVSNGFRGWWRGRLCLFRLTTVVKIQTSEIQMKFCRGRDGLVFVRFARPKADFQADASCCRFNYCCCRYYAHRPCLNAMYWIHSIDILLPLCTLQN